MPRFAALVDLGFAFVDAMLPDGSRLHVVIARALPCSISRLTLLVGIDGPARVGPG